MELHDCDRRHRQSGHGRKSTSPNPVDEIEDFPGDGVDTSPRRALAIFCEKLKVKGAEEGKTGADVQRGRRSAGINISSRDFMYFTGAHPLIRSTFCQGTNNQPYKRDDLKSGL